MCGAVSKSYCCKKWAAVADKTIHVKHHGQFFATNDGEIEYSLKYFEDTSLAFEYCPYCRAPLATKFEGENK